MVGDIPIALQDANLGAELTRDLNFFDPKNSKEYPGYFEGFSGQKNSKVDVKSDAQLRILRCNGYMNYRLGKKVSSNNSSCV